MNHKLIVGLGLAALMAAGCSGGGTTPDPPNQHLAGGGRDSSNDPFAGGSEDSGPNSPRDPDGSAEPYPGFIPLFYGEVDCTNTPGEQVLDTQAEWQTWWTDHTACLREGASLDPPPNTEPGSSGGGTIGPDEPYDPYGEEAPEVDFDDYVMVAISLESASGYGRSIWVQGVDTTETGSTVRYEVSTPGEDCFGIFEDGNGGEEPPSGEPGEQPEYISAPTVAVLVPRPVADPVTFDRVDTTYDCGPWEPDPNTPWTLYYTDADCDLGAREQVITSEGIWHAWLDSAQDCDYARWGDPEKPTEPPSTGGGGGSDPGVEPQPDGPVPPIYEENPSEDPNIDPAPTPPGLLGIDVDFTTHAVIILRADAQNRWGGGIWLDAFEPDGNGGTKITYTVVVPNGECPQIDGGQVHYPTVAVRVPLPLPGPFSYERHIDNVDCNWNGTDVGGGDTPVGPPPEPRPL